MKPKLFWCYLLSAIFFFKGSRVSSEDDEYEVTTTVTSLTGSQIPFAYIDTNCTDPDTSTCRSFSCSAFSNSTPTIYWSLKQNGGWKQLQRNSSSKEMGLQLVSDIVLTPQQFGYLRCFVNNTYGNTEVVKEVVPYNNRWQRFIRLEEEEFQFAIIDEKDAEFYWYLVLRGNPRPTLSLYADDVEIGFKTSSKYSVNFENLIDVTDGIRIKLKVTNASGNDLQTNFTLYAENIYENVYYILDFDARKIEKLQINMSFLDEAHINVNCTASSLLPTEIDCQFKPCLDSECTPEYLPAKFYENNLQHTMSLILNSSMVGTLECFANNSVSMVYKNHRIYGMEKSLDILTTVPVKNIDKQKKKIEIEPLQSVFLTCAASSFNHQKNISWAYPTLHEDYNEHGIVGSIEDAAFTYQLQLKVTTWNAQNGTFYCKSYLKNGTLEYVQMEVAFKGISEWTYYVIVILLVIMMAILLFIYLKMKRYRKIQKQIKDLNLIDLANFEKGALEHLNPNLTIDDQADLLPYDKTYEFSIERLKLGEQIGSGAFGVVLKAEAEGVFESEPSTTVAVKMVNRNIGDVYIKALASELKIMIHLGKHVNVVNLLGACTKNITKRELLVIVEYCRFGNLKDYLLNHRHSFIDQINKETQQIDFTIGCDILGDKDSEFPYITPSFTNINYTALYGTIKEAAEDVNGESSEAPKSEQDSHYKGDYKSINKPVCTRDLLLWSFQVARGMEYLSSRKVLHGDLAARNVLLTDGNVVKICDFGLARKMYQKDIYKKAGDEMLPVKWMAIEAITDKIFSIQSDVWSFGVVLWEIFSLARTPYPGMEFNEHFCEKLLEGYRMKSPQFATQEIYEIMLECWNAEATLRPSFTQLVQKIGNILDERLREHYIDMNAGYLKMNARRIQEESTDYLSMVGAPDFKKYSSISSYVNLASKEDDDSNTYL